MANPILANRLAQVGIIVRDLETSKKEWAKFLGVPVPPTCDGGQFEVTHTTIDGQPAPDANCWMAFFDLENIQVELIQPNGVKSTWQDFLDEKGEGIHHIAFPVKNTAEKVQAMDAEMGVKCVQAGLYGGANGEYAYLDTRSTLKCFIETLESY